MTQPPAAEPTPAGQKEPPRRDAVFDTLMRLRERWPELFTKPVPLAIGTFQAIRAAEPSFPFRELKSALTRWCDHSTYLQAMSAPDAERVAIDGQRQAVSDAHRQRAATQLQERLAHCQKQRALHDAKRRAKTPRPAKIGSAKPTRSAKPDGTRPARPPETRRAAQHRANKPTPSSSAKPAPPSALALALAAARKKAD